MEFDLHSKTILVVAESLLFTVSLQPPMFLHNEWLALSITTDIGFIGMADKSFAYLCNLSTQAAKKNFGFYNTGTSSGKKK